ncbi:MAG: hypothetical protein GXX82_11625 [Syntrophorhabdus sp.]|nr:hypothetical protein [Syntrophorhabdus sp.]
MSVDVLIYVEDPGAANYVAGLPSELDRLGWKVYLAARGFGHSHLQGMEVEAGDVPESVSAEDLLMRLSPKVVVVGTSENTETLAFELVAAAKRNRMITVGAVDAFGNAQHRFRGNSPDPLSHVPDWLIVPDELTKKAYVDLGHPAGRTIVCGHPHYDRVHDTRNRLEDVGTAESKASLFPGCPEASSVVVFVSEVSTGLGPDQYKKSSDYTLEGRGDRTDRTGIVIEEFLDASAGLEPRPYLVLRMHPKNREEDFGSLLWEFDQISRAEPSLELVYTADLVVGMTTMLLQEAAIVGTRTLSIVPRESEKMSLPTVRAGITPSVATRKDLREVLPRLMSERGNDFLKAVEAMFPYGSLGRAAEFIESLIIDRSHEGPSVQESGVI